MQAKKNETISPRWLTLQQAAIYTGVTKRTLENWEKEKCFSVARVIVPGKSKGRVLVDRESLDGFIKRFLDAPPQVIAMNKKRTEAARCGTGQ
jgi:hypothetical protein